MHPDEIISQMPDWGQSPESTLSRLDEQLDMLEKSLGVLSSRLDPVSSSRFSEPKDTVSPAPSSALRGKVERLRRLNGELEQIINALDL